MKKNLFCALLFVLAFISVSCKEHDVESDLHKFTGVFQADPELNFEVLEFAGSLSVKVNHVPLEYVSGYNNSYAATDRNTDHPKLLMVEYVGKELRFTYRDQHDKVYKGILKRIQ